MMMSHMQKRAMLDSAAACAVQLSNIMMITQPHSSQYKHQQQISTHNVTRALWFANTFDGSAVIWLA
jgi:hypothetical protein